MKYRKRDPEVEALPFDGTFSTAGPIITWLAGHGITAKYQCAEPGNGGWPNLPKPAYLLIVDVDEPEVLLTGWVALAGGELHVYPDADVFEALYEPVTDDSTQAKDGSPGCVLSQDDVAGDGQVATGGNSASTSPATSFPAATCSHERCGDRIIYVPKSGFGNTGEWRHLAPPRVDVPAHEASPKVHVT